MNLQSALRKTISLAAAIAIALPSPMLASNFARTPGVVGGGAPVVLDIKPVSSAASADLKLRAGVGLGLFPMNVTAANDALRLNPSIVSQAQSPALEAVQRLEAAGVNVGQGGLT